MTTDGDTVGKIDLPYVKPSATVRGVSPTGTSAATAATGGCRASRCPRSGWPSTTG